MEDVLITGGTSGLGRGIVEALLARSGPGSRPGSLRVHVLARSKASVAGATMHRGDATDRETMARVVAEVRPTTLLLNAGATPHMAALDEQTWETFGRVWNNDVKATLHGLQAAFALPLAPGSRVITMSSGAANIGAPLSGSYAGAKRMIWLMARDANAIAEERGLSLRVQTLLPMHLLPDTPLGHTVAAEYARRRGISVEAHVAERYGASVTAATLGEKIAEWLTAPPVDGVAFSVHADGVKALVD